MLLAKIGGGILTLMLLLISIFSTIAYRASAKTQETQEAVTELQTTLPFVLKGIDEIKASQIRLEDKVDNIHTSGQ